MKSNKSEKPQPLEPRTIETTAQRRNLQLVEQAGGLTLQAEEDTFNPYDRKPTDASGKPVKRDLRKLSEWIKTMRAVEEKKARGED